VSFHYIAFVLGLTLEIWLVAICTTSSRPQDSAVYPQVPYVGFVQLTWIMFLHSFMHMGLLMETLWLFRGRNWTCMYNTCNFDLVFRDSVNKMWNLRVLVIGILSATTYVHCTPALRMEAACSSETFVDTNKSRWYRDQESFSTFLCSEIPFCNTVLNYIMRSWMLCTPYPSSRGW
jgi:hypothetical protein